MNKEKETTLLEKNYLEDLNKIKETIKTNQNKAMVVVNSAMIMTYYQIGIIINKRKQWGNKYIQKLSSDLREYGKGYSVRNLHYMIQFSETFTNNEIVQLPVAQISWRSLITIMTKCKNHEEQLWYVSASKKYGWGKELLLNQIAMKAYE